MKQTKERSIMEEWRPVVGFEGFYEVSDFGNVRSRGVSIKPWINAGTGYPMVDLKVYGKVKKLSVHRMVLFAFRGPPEEGKVCCHEDGNPRNNKLENLRWDTSAANAADLKRHGRALLGVKNHKTKLTAEKVLEIRERLRFGQTCAHISRVFKVTPEAINAIKLGKNWAWLE